MNFLKIQILSHIKIFGGKILQLGNFYGFFLSPNLDLFLFPLNHQDSKFKFL
jgi:hypothetical protein